MGAADVVPGVSGGTIAFITGIYEELLKSIKAVNLKTFRLLFKEGIKPFWKEINGRFLLTLFTGIGVSVVSLAKVLEMLLTEYPVLVWAFFFGLIVASAIYIAKQINNWKIGQVIALLLGIASAYIITRITPAQTTDAWWFLILSGAIAICAMILPGISGSFILLLLGKYAYVISAVSDFNVQVIALVGIGAVVGLVSFANVLSWLLNKYHNHTIAVLAGFMIGSLNKIWPWKETVETYIDRHGEVQPLIQDNVLPSRFVEVTGTTSYLWPAVLLAVVGFVLIFAIEKMANNKPVAK